MSFEIKVKCWNCGCDEPVSFYNVEFDKESGEFDLVCPKCGDHEQVSKEDVETLRSVTRK